MRVYGTPYELMSEIGRDLWEMGHIVKPKSMQNKNIEGNDDYITREITNYGYCLTSMKDHRPLFIGTENPLQVKRWADAEFEERISMLKTNPGDAWKLRQGIWEEFLVDGKFDYSYPERIGNQIRDVVFELHQNPDSRQGIIMIWDRETDINNIGGKKRVPCSMYYQVLVRNGQVDLIYNQRSADLMAHMGNDVYLAWKLKEYISKSLVAYGLEVKNGFLFHNIGSLHSYKKDWKRLEEMNLELKEYTI